LGSQSFWRNVFLARVPQQFVLPTLWLEESQESSVQLISMFVRTRLKSLPRDIKVLHTTICLTQLKVNFFDRSVDLRRRRVGRIEADFLSEGQLQRPGS
jgi:hypothetical protein